MFLILASQGWYECVVVVLWLCCGRLGFNGGQTLCRPVNNIAGDNKLLRSVINLVLPVISSKEYIKANIF